MEIGKLNLYQKPVRGFTLLYKGLLQKEDSICRAGVDKRVFEILFDLPKSGWYLVLQEEGRSGVASRVRRTVVQTAHCPRVHCQYKRVSTSQTYIHVIHTAF